MGVQFSSHSRPSKPGRWRAFVPSPKRKSAKGGVSARTRHWELWQQFVRECYLRLLITIHLVSTTVEVADILTKALPKDDPRYKKFRDILMNITD